MEYHRDQFWHQNVNDMTGVSSYISLFADDAKLLRNIGKHNDCYMRIINK